MFTPWCWPSNWRQMDWKGKQMQIKWLSINEIKTVTKLLYRSGVSNSRFTNSHCVLHERHSGPKMRWDGMGDMNWTSYKANLQYIWSHFIFKSWILEQRKYTIKVKLKIRSSYADILVESDPWISLEEKRWTIDILRFSGNSVSRDLPDPEIVSQQCSIK